MGRALAACAALWCLGALAQSPDAGTLEADRAATFVLRVFDANLIAKELAPGLSSALSQRFAAAKLKVITDDDIKKALGLERQKALMGCDASNCLVELADALGARFVGSGRVDRFGDRFLVAASIWDQQKNETRVRAQRETKDASMLPQAIDELADELLGTFGIPPRVGVKLADRVNPMGFNLGLKLGTQLITSLFKFAPVGELELAYRLNLDWAVFFQVAFGIIFGAQTQLSVTPGLLGVRYFFRSEKSFQPVVGGGLGVLTTIAAAQGKSRLSLIVSAGLNYQVSQQFGVGLEGTLDLLGAAYTLIEQTSISAVNVGLSLGVFYRF